jgi:glutamate-1-semialdehyde 2,1-aminomutase
MSQSQQLFRQAQEHLVGGVNSAVRAFTGVGGEPVFMERGEGPYLFDVDGRRYVDYVLSFGPLAVGHAHPAVVEAVQRAVSRGLSFGTPTQAETLLARKLKSLVPSMDLVRMVNSGTEATMSALRLARGATGRDKVIKFQGCYHGHVDPLLVQAGSGALTLGIPGSPGVPESVVAGTLTLPFNDAEAVRAAFDQYGDDIAAVIVEPVAGNMGCIPPQKGFLQGLRELCDAHDTVLIFDEVMTGFRVAQGGAQERYGVTADMVTYGKIIGAGLPVGAFGGKQEVMSVVSPDGPVYQAGTLSGNPLAMAAGYALLSELKKHPKHYDDLEKKAAYLQTGLIEVLNKYEVAHRINRVGSMGSVFFTDNEVTDFNSANTTDQEFFKIFFHQMLERGVYLPPSPFESWFLATTHSQDLLDKTVEAADSAIEIALKKMGDA